LREKVKVDATMDEGYVGFARPRNTSGTKAHIGVANTEHDVERAPTMCQCLRRQQERPPTLHEECGSQNSRGRRR